MSTIVRLNLSIFQSTLPVWGATRVVILSCGCKHHFNPRSPCGERRCGLQSKLISNDFNPRSPCGERPAPELRCTIVWIFQSTLPVWGATHVLQCLGYCFRISIHAPRVGSDQAHNRISTPRFHFNPRSPCGERPVPVQRLSACLYFNPRSPCGERPIRNRHEYLTNKFQSTLPVWGATCYAISDGRNPLYFNPRSPCGERQKFDYKTGKWKYFNPRSPCGERLWAF